MGLFGFVGKAIKGIGKVVGGAVKVAAGAAKVAGGLGIIPGGGLIGKAANILLSQKQPMSTSGTKIQIGAPAVLRGNVTQGGYGGKPAEMYGRRFVTPAVLRSSPVMPGGAVATRAGIAPRSAAIPPLQFGGTGSPVKRAKRKAAKRTARKTTRRTKRKSARRSARKLKFGSRAYRQKYLGHK